ncbi:MAG: lamin tail domain-containing protein [Bacteroidales bacterium]
MKKLTLIMAFMPLAVVAQLSDNFESGTLGYWKEVIPGRWNVSPDLPLSGNYSLRHAFDNHEAGTDQVGIETLGLCLQSGATVWQFRLRHGHNPSSSNNWTVFLVSDAQPNEMRPGGAVNGFAVGVNFTGSDDMLRLLRISNGTTTTVANSGINWETSIGPDSAAHIRVERTPAGEWTLLLLDNEEKVLSSASGQDSFLPVASWFGIFYRYTSTLDRLLWFDDFRIDGQWVTDTIPPAVEAVRPAGSNSILVKLSEMADESALSVLNWLLQPGDIRPVSISWFNSHTLLLNFNTTLNNRQEYHLSVSSLCDIAGNCSADTTANFIYAVARQGDIVITEIMADQLPEVGLPPYEYVEILNRAGYTLNLSQWSFSYNTTTMMLPDITLDSGSYMVLCATIAADALSDFGSTISVKSFPVLADKGALLVLRDSSGMMIHGVSYSDRWHTDVLKKDGGWSLEMIDTGHPFAGRSNWTSSVSRRGGTPGAPNSCAAANPDLIPVRITNLFPVDSLTLAISFNKSISNMAEAMGGYSGEGFSISSIAVADPLQSNFILTLTTPLGRGKIYSLLPPASLRDFSGNSPEAKPFRFALTERSLPDDLKFNEVLFDPWPDEYDFVEFVNLSERTIDASRLLLQSENPRTGSLSSPFPLSEEPRCILPGDYFVVTIDPQLLVSRFFSANADRIFAVPSLPSMPDDQAIVTLYNRELDIIDRMSYDKAMHFSLLSVVEGVSLEKVTPQADSWNRQNWHSASGAAGWATPGAVNSVFSGDIPNRSAVSLSGRRITPDYDGIDDVIVINFTTASPENVLRVVVFTENGYPVRTLVDNLYTGYEALITWDGTDNSGRVLPTGIYVIWISSFDNAGNTTRHKEAVAIIR